MAMDSNTTQTAHQLGCAVLFEATAGIEPAIKVLQTSALPLGYVAVLTTL